MLPQDGNRLPFTEPSSAEHTYIGPPPQAGERQGKRIAAGFLDMVYKRGNFPAADIVIVQADEALLWKGIVRGIRQTAGKKGRELRLLRHYCLGDIGGVVCNNDIVKIQRTGCRREQVAMHLPKDFGDMFRIEVDYFSPANLLCNTKSGIKENGVFGP
jgi:hypothetical protein